MIDPQGNRFFSTAITCVKFRQDGTKADPTVSPYGDACLAKYGSEDAWRKAVAPRLMGWGFNTLGSWSDNTVSKVDVGGKHLAYTAFLGLGSSFVAAPRDQGGQGGQKGLFPDVFDPNFATWCNAKALEKCTPMKDDPNLIGYFVDNELRWGPIGATTMR